MIPCLLPDGLQANSFFWLPLCRTVLSAVSLLFWGMKKLINGLGRLPIHSGDLE